MEHTTSYVDVGNKNNNRFNLVDTPDPATVTVSIVIAGRAGVGKTALANAISKEVVGTESSGLDDDSMEFLYYSTNHQGLDVKICDSPGLKGNFEGNFLTTLKEKVGQCDVVIYCMRMDAVRLEQIDVENINLISQSLGVGFWNKTVVALTFANLVTCPPSYQADDSSKESWLVKRAQDWKSEFRSRLYKAGIPEDVVVGIPLVPIGYNKPTLYSPNPWSIPCDKNWLLTFMMGVNRKLGNNALGIVLQNLGSSQSYETKELRSLGGLVGFITSSAPCVKVSTGVGAGIGAGVGVAAGAMFSPVVAAAGGVAGAIGGATFVYTSLTALAQKKQKNRSHHYP